MSKTPINFWLDVSLALIFLAWVWPTFVIRFVFPPGTVADGWSLWGAEYDDWGEFQFRTICVFSMAVVVHVIHHWPWVCGVFHRKFFGPVRGQKRGWSDGEQTLIGVGILVVLLFLLGTAFVFAKLTVRGP